MTGTIDAALDKVPYRITDPERIPAKRYYDQDFFELEKEHSGPRSGRWPAGLRKSPKSATMSNTPSSTNR
jgi:hypothetical protein